MKRATKPLLIGSLVLAGAIYANATFAPAQPSATVAPVVDAKHYVDRQAVINALSTESQIVGLSGRIEKSVTLSDDKWYGAKTYDLTLAGEFKLGVDTDKVEITTKGNTVVVRFPHPKIISVDMPFDNAVISKDVGWARKDIDESELQGLYGKARSAAIDEINANEEAMNKAADSVEDTLEDIIEAVPYVENVMIVEDTKEVNE